MIGMWQRRRPSWGCWSACSAIPGGGPKPDVRRLDGEMDAEGRVDAADGVLLEVAEVPDEPSHVPVFLFGEDARVINSGI